MNNQFIIFVRYIILCLFGLSGLGFGCISVVISDADQKQQEVSFFYEKASIEEIKEDLAKNIRNADSSQRVIEFLNLRKISVVSELIDVKSYPLSFNKNPEFERFKNKTAYILNGSAMNLKGRSFIGCSLQISFLFDQEKKLLNYFSEKFCP